MAESQPPPSAHRAPSRFSLVCEMFAQGIGFARDCPTQSNTHSNTEGESFLVHSRARKGAGKTVTDAGLSIGAQSMRAALCTAVVAGSSAHVNETTGRTPSMAPAN